MQIKVKVTEMFESIQGEGPRSGRHSFFIRLHGCNATCNYCDTKYSWGNCEAITVDLSDISNRIINYKQHIPQGDIVITGGEPYLQPEAVAEIIDFDSTMQVTIESNGSINPDLHLNSKRSNCILVISPKIHMLDANYKKSLGRALEVYQDRVYFKFLVGKEFKDSCSTNADDIKKSINSSLQPIKELIDYLKIPQNLVFLMPITSPKLNNSKAIEYTQAVHKQTAKYCKDNYYNFSPRLHMLFFDGGKGV